MTRSDMVRLITAYCNLHTFRTVDEFSGDYMMTLEEGNNLINFIEKHTKIEFEPENKENLFNIDPIDYEAWKGTIITPNTSITQQTIDNAVKYIYKQFGKVDKTEE